MVKRKLNTETKREQIEKRRAIRQGFYQRLYNAFGVAAQTDSKKEPRSLNADHLCYTLARHAGFRHKALRTRTVSAGFDKVVSDLAPVGFAQSIDDIVCYVSELRVQASLFANYICTQALCSGGTLPELKDSFFKECLRRCANLRVDKKCNLDFDGFKNATGCVAPVWRDTALNISQILVYEATSMATDASNRIAMHFERRRTALLRYTIKDLFPVGEGMNGATYARRVHRLITGMVKGDSTSALVVAFRDLLPTAEDVARFSELHEEDQAVFATVTTDQTHIRYLFDRFNGLVGSDTRRAFEAVCKEAFELHPEKTKSESKLRSAYIKSCWTRPTPPKELAVLPLNRTGAAFVRLDTKALLEVFPNILIEEGPFWYKSVLDPHSSRANIRCIRESKAASTEANVFQAIDMARINQTSPWFVDSTFLTDGVQVKIIMKTPILAHPGADNVWRLDSAGDNVRVKSKVSLQQVLSRGSGLWDSRDISASREDFENVQVTGVDPGQIKILGVCSAPGQFFKREKAPILLQSCRDELGSTYRQETLATHSEEVELRRRRINRPYNDSLISLSQSRKRTYVLQDFKEYCIVYFREGRSIWSELLAKHRRTRRFSRSSAVQREIAKMADRVAGRRDRDPRKMRTWRSHVVKTRQQRLRRRKGHRDKRQALVFFEKSSLSPQRGGAAAPVKKLKRAISIRVPTALVPAANTTQFCIGCGRRTTIGDSYRTRQCTTDPGEDSCSLHRNSRVFTFDRDDGGGCNMGIKGEMIICKEDGWGDGGD